jgi:ribonuclease HI
MLVDSVFCDGGLLGTNPNPLGGTWSWCHIYREEMVNHASGVVEPHEFKMTTISNNVSELLAMVNCLDALPNGWSGGVYTDSNVTAKRAERPRSAKFNGVPQKLIDRLRAVRERLGRLEFVLLAGHPSESDLIRGRKVKSRLPVSKWNKLCDDMCNKERADFEADDAAYERLKAERYESMVRKLPVA